jgi:hypothetical protein
LGALCEATSVIVKNGRVLEAFQTFDAFKKVVPNKTLCGDSEIVRVGFMVPDDVKHFIEGLERQGLRHLVDGAAADIVVIDQLRGPTTRCNWIEFGHVDLSGNRVAAARLVGSRLKEVVTPPGWKFEPRNGS